MLVIFHVGRWLYWGGVARFFPWPWGFGREPTESVSFGITIEFP